MKLQARRRTSPRKHVRCRLLWPPHDFSISAVTLAYCRHAKAVPYRTRRFAGRYCWSNYVAGAAPTGAGLSGQTVERLAERLWSKDAGDNWYRRQPAISVGCTAARGGRSCAPDWNQRDTHVAADAPGKGLGLEAQVNGFGEKATPYRNRILIRWKLEQQRSRKSLSGVRYHQFWLTDFASR